MFGHPTDGGPLGIARENLLVGDDPFAFRPPIDVVDFAKGHPQSSVVGVVVGFVRDRGIHGIRAGHFVPIWTMDRPKHRFGPGLEQVAGYQLAIPHHVDPVRLLDGCKLSLGSSRGSDPKGNQQQQRKGAMHGRKCDLFKKGIEKTAAQYTAYRRLGVSTILKVVGLFATFLMIFRFTRSNTTI